MNTIEDLIENKRQEKEVKENDLDEILEEWQASVSSLLDNIENWVPDPDETDDFDIDRSPISVHEEDLGEYEIDELKISIVDDEILIEPKGRFIVGAYGRVDLKSPQNKFEPEIFVLRSERNGENEEKNWYRVIDPISEDYEEVTETSFLELIEEKLG